MEGNRHEAKGKKGNGENHHMKRQNFLIRYVLVAIGLMGLAGLSRYWIGPELGSLPEDYMNETFYAAESRFRETPTSGWENITLIARRVDQTITVSGRTAFIQGNLHWISEQGRVIFENTGLYAVDRHTRMNMSGFGNVDRTGQFLFPLQVERRIYRYWDQAFIGPRVATFDHTEMMNGLSVYVFHFIGTDLDETEGYSFLADVPEHYHAHTDGKGKIWIEPVSGMVLDYEEQGVSYFVAPSTNKRLDPFYEWSDRYTLETRTAQLKLAHTARRRILLMEIFLPIGLALMGLIWFGLGFWIYCNPLKLKSTGATR